MSASDVAPYVHPALSALAILGLIHLGSLGLGGRRRRWSRDLALHRRRGPVVWSLLLIAWSAGVLLVAFARPDLALAESRHFWLGTATLLLVSVQMAMRRQMYRPWVRSAHPWIGAAALALTAFQTLTGFALLP